jgi:hypothetical protein
LPSIERSCRVRAESKQSADRGKKEQKRSGASKPMQATSEPSF